MSERIITVDIPLSASLTEMIESIGTMRLWEAGNAPGSPTAALFTYGHPSVTDAMMAALPELRVISNFGVGVDHIDVAAATARGIPVGNTPGAVDGSTADMTMALILATARNMIVGDRFARGSEFTMYDPSVLVGTEVHDATLGIVGMGAIGKQVARRARGFDMQVWYHNRNRDEAAEAALGVQYCSFAELLARCQFIALNVPMTPETHHLIGETELRAMRSDAILVNAARGGVVDTEALLRALTEGWIRAAGLDVTEPEPLPRDHPLLRLENLVIMPHLGSAADGSRQRMAEMAVANLRAGLEGRDLPTPASG